MSHHYARVVGSGIDFLFMLASRMLLPLNLGFFFFSCGVQTRNLACNLCCCCSCSDLSSILDSPNRDLFPLGFILLQCFLCLATISHFSTKRACVTWLHTCIVVECLRCYFAAFKFSINLVIVIWPWNATLNTIPAFDLLFLVRISHASILGKMAAFLIGRTISMSEISSPGITSEHVYFIQNSSLGRTLKVRCKFMTLVMCCDCVRG